jgi:hypothetical protein
MSVTFFSDAQANESIVKETCPCVHWSEEEQPDHACMLCHGAGVTDARETDEPSLNIANGNARPLLALLGFHTEHLAGQVSLAEMRRALLVATNLFHRRAPLLTRASSVLPSYTRRASTSSACGTTLSVFKRSSSSRRPETARPSTGASSGPRGSENSAKRHRGAGGNAPCSSARQSRETLRG